MRKDCLSLKWMRWLCVNKVALENHDAAEIGGEGAVPLE